MMKRRTIKRTFMLSASSPSCRFNLKQEVYEVCINKKKPITSEQATKERSSSPRVAFLVMRYSVNMTLPDYSKKVYMLPLDQGGLIKVLVCEIYLDH